jgi:hypothetical protein
LFAHIDEVSSGIRRPADMECAGCAEIPVTARHELKQTLSVKRISRPFINEGGRVAVADFGDVTGQTMDAENSLP